MTQPSGFGFMIPRGVWLALNDFGGERLSRPPSISNVMNSPDPYEVETDPSTGFAINWRSEPVHIRMHDLWTTCPDLAHSILDPCKGRRDVCRRLPVTSNYTEVLISSDDDSQDWLPCPNRVIKTLTLRLTDEYNRPIALESPWSCSLVFMER